MTLGLGAFLDFMRGKWGWALAIVLLIALTTTRETLERKKGDLAAEQAAHKFTVENYRLAAAQARANDLAHAAEVKAKDDRIAQEKQNAIEAQLADARAAVARYVERMRVTTAANSGSVGGKDLPASAGSPGDPAGSSGLALVPVGDLDICARNTVLARGWQDWYAKVSEQGR